MNHLTTFVLSRVLEDGDRDARELNAAADLEVRLRAQIERQGLVLDRVSDVEVETGTDGRWFRLTRTATARPRLL